MTANMKVNAGTRLPITEARVGELYSIPLYWQILIEYLPCQKVFSEWNFMLLLFIENYVKSKKISDLFSYPKSDRRTNLYRIETLNGGSPVLHIMNRKI